jgi:low temperature requirement protein LtrA
MQLHSRMTPRDPHEAHRASTPLELFFDLTFVAAVAQAAEGLQQGLVDGNARHVLVVYPLVFFAIWWGWMNFTWFASAYDTDDVLYRIAVLVQMAGVLILAAGVPRALDHWDFSLMVVGYVVMRLAMVSLWTRAAISDPPGRICALRYASGITLVQVGWSLCLLLHSTPRFIVFGVLAVAELAVPIFAEAKRRTAWHPGHIAERYGLFTIIVLGETILATSIGVRTALANRASFGELAPDLVGALLIVFSMWWIYFDMPASEIVQQVRRSFTRRLNGAFAWGYGHYFVFAGAAATGAGLTVAIDQATGHSNLTSLEAGFAETVPVALYLVAVWGLHARYKPKGLWKILAVPAAVALILASSALSEPVLATGIIMAVLVATNVWVYRGSATVVA